MAIAFRDFTPNTLRSGFFNSDYEPLDSIVARANQWMTQTGARVVNVETVLLPNFNTAQGSTASGIRTSGEMRSFWFQIVRVWYEVDEPPPLSGR